MGKIATRVIISDSETGKIIKDVYYRGTQNGDDWVIVYRDAFENLACNAPLTAWKVFGILASKQEFEGGIHITKKAIAEKLKVSYDNVMRGFKWLKENGYVKEHKVDGVPEILLNPDVTTCGKKKEEKIKLWNSI